MKRVRWKSLLVAAGAVLIAGMANPTGSFANERDRFAEVMDAYNAALGSGDRKRALELIASANDMADRMAEPPAGLPVLRLLLARLQSAEGQSDSAGKTLEKGFVEAVSNEPLDLELLAAFAGELAGGVDGSILDAVGERVGGLLARFGGQREATVWALVNGHLSAGYIRNFSYRQANLARDIATAEGPHAPAVARILGRLHNDIGHTYFTGGYCTEALYFLQVATSYLAQSPESEDWLESGTVAQNLADVLDCLGETEAASGFAERAVQTRTRLLGADAPKVAESLLTLFRHVREPQRKLETLGRAIEIFSRHGMEFELLQARLQRALFLKEEGRGADSMREIEAVAKRLGEIGQAPSDLMNLALIARAELLADTDGPEAGLIQAMVPVRELLDRFGDRWSRFQDRSEGGLPLWPAAASVLSRAARLALEAGHADLAWDLSFRVLSMTGMRMLAGRELYDMLGGQFRRSSENAHGSRSDIGTLVAAASLLDDTAADKRNVAFHAFQQASFSRTSASAALFADRHSERTSRRLDDARRYQNGVALLRKLQAEWISLQRGSRPAAAGDAGRNLSVVSRIGEELAALKSMTRGSSIAGQNIPYVAENIISALQPDEVLIGYYCTDRESFAWVLGPGSADPGFVRLRPGCAGVEQLSHRIREGISARGDFRGARPLHQDVSDRRAHLLDAAADAYEALWQPLERLVEGKRHVIVVPTDHFGEMPWHMLLHRPPRGAGATGEWLVQRHAISVSPSPAAFMELRGLSGRVSGSRLYLGIGDPVFAPGTTAAGLQLPRLPETEHELRKVAEALAVPNPEILLRERAGEAALASMAGSEALREFRIVHFATHGLRADETGTLGEPAIALSLPASPTGGEDGLLTVSEIEQLELNADFVILSACNTAAGESGEAEPLSGLARAFLYAGARSILVSHWPVESDAAVRIVTGMFAELAAEPGLRRAEALRRTLVKMIDGAGRDADPVRWAPFFIVGD